MSVATINCREKGEAEVRSEISLSLYLGGEGAALLDGGDGVDIALEVQAEGVGIQQVF